MVKVAADNGAKIGNKIQADFGAGFKTYTLYFNPIDKRVNGLWAA
jgi:hypothetical protein